MRRTTLVLVLCLALSPLTLAQEEPSAEALLADKLDEVTDLLRELIDAQRTELALRALQVKSSRVERIEARETKLKDRLTASRTERDGVVAELDRLEEELGQMKPGTAFERIALQNKTKLESRLEALENLIEETEVQLSEVEISLLDQEQGLLKLESMVDAGLEGL